ncbi:MAG: 30S ribosomal protein S8 [Micavibrio sp.]|jgi:small subunit ribosomal protein S8|nr:MAG: 30S ribosomal protein S8 [Micavibrio sp.]
MTMSDTLGDLLTRIRNGQNAGLEKIKSPASKLRENVLEVLQKEGYIQGYTRVEREGGLADLEISLKYYDGEPVIRKIDRVSKPGRRIYSKVKELPQVYNGLGISILSTPRGVMSDHDARDQNVGGEVLCQIF